MIEPHRLALDADPASPWLIVPPAVRTAFDRLARAGVPLGASAFGAPLLGVKCGCNEAFIVHAEREADVRRTELAMVRADGRRGAVEQWLLRPLLRGESTAPWRPADVMEWILWTHDDAGAPLRTLPSHAARWLAQWRTRLAERADVRGHMPWWSLFRTASASPAHARVVWADMGRAPRALVLRPGDATVPLNSCYVLPCRDPLDAHALAALLNAPVVAAWLHVLAEPARGAYRRFLAWTVAMLPVPHDWSLARATLGELGERAAEGRAPEPDELLAATLRTYHVPQRAVAPLLAWWSS
jgi:hypothetical protein